MKTTSEDAGFLGSGPMALSPVGLGTWALGGSDWVSSWGPQDQDQSIATIRHAVESGVNWVDTAAVYGLGAAERLVQHALQPFSENDRPVIFTKGGMVWDEQNRRASSVRSGKAEILRRQVEDSLRRLGVERIDLYFMHWPATDAPLEEYWSTLVTLREQGKLGAIGLSNHTVDDVRRAHEIGTVDAVQPPFSAIIPDALTDLLPWCAANGVDAFVYSPMGSGLLTGAFDQARVESLPEDDWRRRSPAFTTQLAGNLQIATAVGRVAHRHNVTPAAVAIAWTIGFSEVRGAIVGARTPQQVDSWLPAAGLVLDRDDYAEITPTISPAG